MALGTERLYPVKILPSEVTIFFRSNPIAMSLDVAISFRTPQIQSFK